MKNGLKRLLSVAIGLMMFVAVFATGCSIPDPPIEGGRREDVDSSRTQLYVHNFAGGYGTEYLYALKDRFEAEYSEVVFDPNNPSKKGVQIMIDGDTTSVQQKIATSNFDIFFAGINYVPDLVSQNVLLDITEWITEPLTEFGEGRSIEDKMSDPQKDYLCINGKYYAVPHYFDTSGVIYDIDLFNEYNLFLAKNGCPSEAYVSGGSFDGEYIFTDSEDDLSAGADGKYGTVDDGLPATYKEFYALCDQMVSVSVVPFIWPGKYMDMHTTYLMESLKAEADGFDDLMLNFTFDGEAQTLIDVSADGTITEKAPVAIDSANGYRLYEQASLYYAVKFVETILKNNYYETNYCLDTTTHLQAQEHFIRSRFDSYYQKPIAMLMDGIWWENEATAAFERMANAYPGTSKTDRNFGFMPMPKPTQEQVGENHTVLAADLSF